MAIHERIAQHRLGHRARWLLVASEAELKAAYLASHVMVLLSRHEGFCVPLVEAMAFKLPIVARACAAVPETIGDAGIVWPDADPVLYAASANRVLRDGDLRSTLQERGADRYRAAFAPAHLRRRFIELVGLAR
jgi:glycosyltransferase involved in cell wall biosynthesis